MKKLILHIGNAKTGTTTIQQYCSRYEKELFESGLVYCEVGRDYYSLNHKAFHFSFLKEMGKPYKVDPVASIGDLSGYTQTVVNEINDSSANLFLISFEGLAGLAMYGDKSKMILEEFKRSVSSVCDVEVICFIREPWESLVSNYNERCKNKNFTGPFLDFVESSHDAVLDQFYSYKFFSQIFDRVKPVYFGPYKGSDFIKHFFENVGIEIEPLPFKATVNKSLEEDEIEFSRILAVKDLKLSRAAELKLLNGDKFWNDDKLFSFINRLEKINNSNYAFFKEFFGFKCKGISLSEIFMHERLVNAEYLRKRFI